MARPKHTNSTNPRIKRNREGRVIRETYAHAPYNFVPLAHKIAFTDKPLPQDSYHNNGLTGYIDCTIKTESPTYIRGMIDIENFRRLQEMDISEDITEKERLAKFFSTSQGKKRLAASMHTRQLTEGYAAESCGDHFL